jgi:hypothetical protein
MKISSLLGVASTLQGASAAAVGAPSTPKHTLLPRFGPLTFPGTQRNAAILRGVDVPPAKGKPITAALDPNALPPRFVDVQSLFETGQRPFPDGACHFAYLPVLSFNELGHAGVFDRFGEVGIDRVVQGALGDASLGAVVQTLISQGLFSGHARNILQRNEAFNANVFVASLGEPPELVGFDDELPTVDISRFNNDCPGEMGYSGVGPTEEQVYFVPLLEKAIVEFLERHPELKANPAAAGYAGLEGLAPALAMRLIAGTAVTTVVRSTPGLDVPMLSNLLGALANNLPATLTTATVEQVPSLGTAFDEASQTATLATGRLSIVNAQDGILRFESLAGQTTFLVAGHTYGMMRGKLDANQGPLAQPVTFRNPWNKNPDSATSANRGPQQTLRMDEWLSVAVEVNSAAREKAKE